jgi:hypothetical protein
MAGTTSKLGLTNSLTLGELVGTWHDNWSADNNAIEQKLAATFAGNPNGSVQGYFEGMQCFDTVADELYICTTAGDASTSVWTKKTGGTNSGTNTGDQNIFSTIAVSGQSNVVADTTSDTLTLAAGTNITITTNASTDTITINSTASGSSSRYNTTMTTAGTGTANMAALVADIEYTAANNLVLFIPAGDYTLKGTGYAILADNQKSVIRGDGVLSRLIIDPTGSGSTTYGIVVSTLGEHDTGTANQVTVTSVTEVNGTGVLDSTATIYKVVVSSASGLSVGQPVSLLADVLLEYGKDAWTDTAGDALVDEYNWQHEMARILYISGTDVYLDAKLEYSAASYNAANYKVLRTYPKGSGVDWSDFVFDTTDDILTYTGARPRMTCAIFGVDNVKFNVDFIRAYEGTVRLSALIDPDITSTAYQIANGYIGGTSATLGYHVNLDAAIRGGKYRASIKEGGRHVMTSTWLEEAVWSISNTAFSAGSTTTFSFTTSGNSPAVNDRIYLDMSGATGTINTMPIGTYLITAKTSTTITVNYNSTGKTFSSGTGWGVLFDISSIFRYGSVVHPHLIGGGTNNSFGAFADPHENSIGQKYENISVLSCNGYDNSSTAGRALNTRGVNDYLKNCSAKNMTAFVETTGFARQFNRTNTFYMDDCDFEDQLTRSTSIPLITLSGSSNVTDTRKIIVNNLKVRGSLQKYLVQYTYSSTLHDFNNLNMNVNYVDSTSSPDEYLMDITGGGTFNFRNCLFDFTNTTATNFLCFLKITTTASTVNFYNCNFINIPTVTDATTSKPIFNIGKSGSTISFNNCNISFTGTSNVGRFVVLDDTSTSSSATGTLILNNCNFTNTANLASATSIAYVKTSGDVLTVYEKNCTYDSSRDFLSVSGGTIQVKSDNDLLPNGIGNSLTTETTMASRVLPANALLSYGATLRFTVAGTTTNNANTKTLKLYFGGVLFGTYALAASVSGRFVVSGSMIYCANTNAILVSIDNNYAETGSNTWTLNDATLSIDPATALTFSATGTATANNDIKIYGMRLECS